MEAREPGLLTVVNIAPTADELAIEDAIKQSAEMDATGADTSDMQVVRLLEEGELPTNEEAIAGLIEKGDAVLDSRPTYRKIATRLGGLSAIAAGAAVAPLASAAGHVEYSQPAATDKGLQNDSYSIEKFDSVNRLTGEGCYVDLVYAHPSDVNNHFDTNGGMKIAEKNIQRFLAMQTRYSLRIIDGLGSIELPGTEESYRKYGAAFGEIVRGYIPSEVLADSCRKILVLYDGSAGSISPSVPGNLAVFSTGGSSDLFKRTDLVESARGPAHELFHELGAVNPNDPDYDKAKTAGNYHAVQPNDLMRTGLIIDVPPKGYFNPEGGPETQGINLAWIDPATSQPGNKVFEKDVWSKLTIPKQENGSLTLADERCFEDSCDYWLPKGITVVEANAFNGYRIKEWLFDCSTTPPSNSTCDVGMDGSDKKAGAIFEKVVAPPPAPEYVPVTLHVNGNGTVEVKTPKPKALAAARLVCDSICVFPFNFVKGTKLDFVAHPSKNSMPARWRRDGHIAKQTAVNLYRISALKKATDVVANFRDKKPVAKR